MPAGATSTRSASFDLRAPIRSPKPPVRPPRRCRVRRYPQWQDLRLCEHRFSASAELSLAEALQQLGFEKCWAVSVIVPRHHWHSQKTTDSPTRRPSWAGMRPFRANAQTRPVWDWHRKDCLQNGQGWCQGSMGRHIPGSSMIFQLCRISAFSCIKPSQKAEILHSWKI